MSTATDIIESTATLHIHTRIPIKALIAMVNQSYEELAIDYWVEDARNVKKANLEIGGTEHNYTYQWEALGNDKWFQIDVETMLRGIERILSRKVAVGPTLFKYIQAGVFEAVTDGEGEFDADALDVIVQAGSFGEIIYA